MVKKDSKKASESASLIRELREDGATLHVCENARSVHDKDAKILYFEGTVEDISKRKQAEADLQSRLEFENLIASMSSKFANAILMDERRDDVLREALAEVARFAGADSASIIASWAGTKSINREYFWSEDSELAEQPVAMNVPFQSEPWALKRLLRNEMVYLKISDRMQKNAKHEHGIMKKMGVDSIVMAPWICTDRTVGAVTLGSKDVDKVWEQDILNALKITAELVGSAYERKISDDKLNDEQKLVRVLLNNSPDRIYFKDRQCRLIRASKAGDKERYRLELQMMQAQKMESLGVMCGGIAHDFNNFLMGILGNAGLALMEMVPESPAWNSVKQIEIVALRAAELTNQLLAYSGKSEPERRVVHMSRIVKEMAHLLRVSIPKTTEIVYDFAPELPGVDCDPVQIRQVVMNLMINASDSIQVETGRVAVSTGIRHCDADMLVAMGSEAEAGDFVYVSVKDNGSGMEQATVDRIFDPFFTTKPTGHGLGMAVVMGVVKAHKGIITVKSKKGKGTEFVVLLPSAGEASHLEEKSKERQSIPLIEEAKVMKILIVEDDEIVRTVARRILENCGYEVDEAPNGDEAVRILNDSVGKYGLVMLDVTLPGTSGKDVLARAKELKKDIPIILMSGYNEDSIRSDFGISGYDGFLKKPFDAVKMTNLVRECCEVSDSKGGGK